MAQRDLTVHLIGDSRSLERAFTRSSKSAKGFEHDIGRASRGALSAAVSFRGLGRALAFGSIQFLGGAGIVFAFKQIISESSRVQEEIEKTGVVFAGNAREVQEWSKTLAQSFGVSEAAALEAAGRFGNMLRPLGFAAPAAAQMSERLVELAADMASFNNTKPDVVLEALSSGLAGQVRPLRQYGVFLSQARIQTEAYQDGIARTGAKLTQAQKVQAAYNIILKDTKNAQGDVARNTESLSVAQSKLTAGVEDLEARLGTALLPSLTSYVNKAAEWLNQTKNQERVQRDFSGAVKDVSGVLKDVAATVRGVDKVTGGFKNTLELLIGLKVASVAVGWASGLGVFGSSARTTTGEVRTLRTALLGLNAIRFGPLTAALAGVALLAAQMRKDALATKTIGDVVGKSSQQVFQNPSGFFQETRTASRGRGAITLKRITEAEAHAITNTSTGEVNAEAAAKAAHGLGLKVGEAIGKSFTTGIADGTRLTGLTAAQRNKFFDSALSRILLRTGLGTIQQQIAGLQKANALIAERLKVTKDVTRRLNLEDQLLQNAAQIKDLNAQQAADALQRRQDAVGEFISRLQLGVTKAQATATFTDDIAALKALQAGIRSEITEFGNTADLAGQLFDVQEQLRQARLSQLTAKQFRQLGLSATGDEITPGVANLKKRVAQLAGNIAGTSLDTPKLQAQLARFRKVLSEGLVPRDVRAKIREMLDGIAADLKNHSGNLTKFAKIDTSKFVQGITGLTPAQVKQLRAGLSQIGAGGTVPQGSFAAAGGGGDIVIRHTSVLDGRVVEQSTTRHQQKRRRRNPPQKRGPHRGG